MENNVIVISRQVGSGGDEIARKLSELINIPVYDKQKIVDLAKESGISENLFDGLEEHPTSSLLYSLVIGLKSGSDASCIASPFHTDNVFGVQANIIRRLADNGSCIFLGRCADYILREHNNLTNIYIWASDDFRVNCVMNKIGLTHTEAVDYVSRIDKRRRSYYDFYTSKAWGDVENYDLTINSEKIGIDNSAKIIAEYVNSKIG
ncbi:MAG: AAA family ATPase [Monoglobaceae bacterium]